MNYIRRMDTPVVSKYILQIKNMEKINKYFTVISITDFYDLYFAFDYFYWGVNRGRKEVIYKHLNHSSDPYFTPVSCLMNGRMHSLERLRIYLGVCKILLVLYAAPCGDPDDNDGISGGRHQPIVPDRLAHMFHHSSIGPTGNNPSS